MRQMAISEFKARCLAVLKTVSRTRAPIQITRFGRPVAEVHPPSPSRDPGDWLGSMSDTGRVVGDIVSPATDESDWEALRS